MLVKVLLLVKVVVLVEVEKVVLWEVVEVKPGRLWQNIHEAVLEEPLCSRVQTSTKQSPLKMSLQ